jgi:LCP family protein required for cell wall assembly
MKTTLKRGIGRAAEVNGNGRAVYPPAIEAPMRRYRQPDPPAHRTLALVGKVFLWLAIAALMLAGGIAGGAYLYVERDIAHGLEAKSFDVKVAEKKLDAVIPNAATTALVLGYDKRAGIEGAETGHSDTMMLVRADPNLETVTMLSFPRDLLVTIHGCKTRLPFVARINDAYGECGSQAALETVRELTGVAINYLITVNFHGFKQIVSHLGGVWLDIDRRYFNDNAGLGAGTRYAKIDLKPGYQKLNGAKALDFVRYRHTDSDLYRLERQQLFVKAIKQRMTDFSALDLPQLVGVVTKNVEVGHISEFDAKTILNYALFAWQLPGGHVFQTKIDVNCFQGYAELTVSESCVRDAVQDFTHPDVQAPEKATDVALGRKRATAGVPRPSDTAVAVLNGNGQAGAAANGGALLAQRGYRIVTGADGNAPSFQYWFTEIYYSDGKGARPAAQVLSKLFSNSRIGPLPNDIAPLSNGALVTVILGQTFHGTIAPAPVDRTPSREPPHVRTDAAATPLLRDARRRVPYRVYYPTLVDSSYHLDSTMPIHVYKLGDHNSIRLTYTNGAGDYWGVQMTDWGDAPVLSGPSDEVVIKGRQYSLYYNGAHLHMVVLRAGDATYWVVNTLLDKLSNETMLAIAKGLKPLPPR